MIRTTHLTFLLSTLLCVTIGWAAGERETIDILAARARAGAAKHGKGLDQPPTIKNHNLRGGLPENPLEQEPPVREAPILQDVLATPPLPPDESPALKAQVAILQAQVEKLQQAPPPDDTETLRLQVANLQEQVEKLSTPPLQVFHALAVQDSGEMAEELVTLDYKLSLSAPANAAGPDQYHGVIFTDEDEQGAGWCLKCVAAVKKFVPGGGRLTVVKSTAKAPGIQEYPAFRWQDGRGVWQQPTDQTRTHYLQPKSLDEFLAWIQSTGPQQPQPAASGYGGAFNGQDLVRQAMAGWKQTLGDAASLGLKIDKSGNQTLNVNRLIKGNPWTPLDVMGRFGHIGISTSSKRYPLQEIGMTYRTHENYRWTIDADPFDITLPQESPKRTAAGEAYGFLEPISIGYTIYTIGSALYKILNPEVTLGLPGTLDLTIKLQDEKFTVDFATQPSVRVDAWLLFDLDVKRIEIVPTNAHITFDPKRQVRNWIKVESRDIAIGKAR